MSSDIEQRIAALAGVGYEPRRICAVLSQTSVEYLDLLEQYGITGNNIYAVWMRCGRNDANFMHLLEAYRNGHGDPLTITRQNASACREAVASGKRLPRSKRLA